MWALILWNSSKYFCQIFPDAHLSKFSPIKILCYTVSTVSWSFLLSFASFLSLLLNPLQKGEKLEKEVSIDCNSFWLRHIILITSHNGFWYITLKQLLNLNIIMKHAPTYNRHDVFYIICFKIARLHTCLNK